MSELIVKEKIWEIALKIIDVKLEIEALKGYSENIKFHPEVCPLELQDEGEKNNHFFNSLLLSWQGQDSWECPFCGRKFTV